jgi:hypothetical protein
MPLVWLTVYGKNCHLSVLQQFISHNKIFFIVIVYRLGVLYDMLQLTWPFSSNTCYVYEICEEIINTKYYKRKWDLLSFYSTLF